MAKLNDSKRHPHQYRLKKSTLLASTKALLALRLRDVRTFDDLFARVEGALSAIPGVGELMIYDTATRIGAHIGLAPTRVYLHAGTRAGLKSLGMSAGGATVELSELPRPLSRLTPAQVEDCLCLYKDKLGNVRT